jgi:tetratricopeptide (TPR) repeat protein
LWFRPRFIVLVLIVLVAGMSLFGYWWRQDQIAQRQAMIERSWALDRDSGQELADYFARHPDDAEVAEALVKWNLRQKRPYEEFREVLDQLCELLPDDPEPFRTRMQLRISVNKLESALSDGLRVLELDSRDALTRYWVAVTAADLNQHDLAVHHVETLLASETRPRQELIVLLVKTHIRAGQYAAAEAALERLPPGPRQHWERMALQVQIDQAAGRHAVAVEQLRTLAAESDVHREFALFRLIESLNELGKESEALAAFSELESLKQRSRIVIDARQQPDNMTAQVKAAEILMTDGKSEEAIRLLELALKRIGPNPQAEKLLAEAYLQHKAKDRPRP